MPYSPHITIYGALPSFCGCDDCGKILRLADQEGTVQPAWDFEVEGVPGYGEENAGQFLMVCCDGGDLSLCWGAPESDLPDPGNCGQVLTLADDGYGNPRASWCDPPAELPSMGDWGKVLMTVYDGQGGVQADWSDPPTELPSPGNCGQVLTLVDDGYGNFLPTWCDAPGGLPEPGGCGQVLTLCDDGNGNPVPAWCDMPTELPSIESSDRYLKTVDLGESGYGLEWAEASIFDPGSSYDWTASQNFCCSVDIVADLDLIDPDCGDHVVSFVWDNCAEHLDICGPVTFDDVREMTVTGWLAFCGGLFAVPWSGCASPSGGWLGQLEFCGGTLRYYDGSQWKTLQTTS